MRRLYWYLNVFGIQGLLLAVCAALFKRSVKVKFYSYYMHAWLTLRTKTSDLAVYEKVVINDEYRLPESINPKVIVDAGANVGISSLYFSVNYPDAKIIAIEPELSNFDMLKNNTGSRGNIYPIRAAIWCESVPLNLSGEMNSDFQVRNAEHEGEVDGITIDKLMKKFSLDHIDVLKVDIEGAEKEVFESSDKWIDKIGMLVIELHERFKPGCEKSVRSAASSFDKSWENGENSFFCRG